MKFLSFSQHLQNGFHPPCTRLGLFGRLQSPGDGVEVGLIQCPKKRLCLFVPGQRGEKIPGNSRSAR